MKTPDGVVAVAAAVVVVAVGLAACDVRTSLATWEPFASLRPELVDACCTCLASRGTGDAAATCTEAVVVDGEITVPPGALYGNGVQAFEDNDVVDDGEIPCLCDDGGYDACVQALDEPAGRLVVPGACIDQLDRTAPCEEACGGVLAFVPLSAE
jgi:hypothetical protein